MSYTCIVIDLQLKQLKMKVEDKAALEVELLKATLSNTIISWNEKCAKLSYVARFGYAIDFEDSASAKSDAAPGDKLNIIDVTSFVQTAVLTIFSQGVGSQKQKVLFSYRHSFSPSDVMEGFTDYDFNKAILLLLKEVFIEAFGTFLITIDKLVK